MILAKFFFQFASEDISSELNLRLIKALAIPQFLFGDAFCLEWLTLLVYANFRSFSIIEYGLFMASGVTITSQNIAEIS
jgi:hypothetical protein